LTGECKDEPKKEEEKADEGAEAIDAVTDLLGGDEGADCPKSVELWETAVS
jgi:hypothetical protein